MENKAVILMILSISFYMELMGQGEWTEATGSDIYYSAGNVGINDQTPGERLSVNGDIYFRNNALITSQVNTSNIDHLWHDDNNNNGGGAPGTWYFVSDMAYKGAGSSRLRAGHLYLSGAPQTNYFAGEIGVGITTPEAKFDIRGGDLLVYQNDVLLTMDNDGSGDGMGVGYVNTSQLKFFADSEIHFRESDSDATKFWMDLDNGKMGIGTQNIQPGYLLGVNGSIICDDLTVDLQQDWPDYVFSDDYKRLSLEDLEQYIIKNKKLPDLPLADEVEKNGVAIGSMNALILEKVENLTLYLIDLEKEETNQEEKIEELMSKFSHGLSDN